MKPSHTHNLALPALSPEEVLDLYGEAVVTDNTPPSSSVLPFEGDDYWKKVKNLESDSFTVKAGAFDDVGVENVELWYRCSLDNWTDQVAWKKRDWQRYGVDSSPQSCGPLFEDEFDGENLDQEKWNVAVRALGFEEGENVGTASIQLLDSQLRMVAEASNGELEYYLRSRTAIIYGAFEVRARAPSWDNSDGAVDWVCMGLMETPVLDKDVVMVRLDGGVRFKTKAGTTFTDTEVTGDLDAREYHTYKIIWAPGEARLYVDGELAATHKVGVSSTPLYVVLLTRSGGLGDPSELWVDYVRMRRAYRAEWEFVPDRYGYYEFFSVATDAAGNREDENAKMLRPGEANVRVAENLVRVAVILTRPNDLTFYPSDWRYTSGGQTWPIDSTHDQEYFGDISENLVSYYDEVSYGVLAIDAEIFGPYVIGSGMETYMRRWEEKGVKNAEYTVDFLKQAIDTADSWISYGRYQTVMVLGAAPQPPMFYGRLDANDANRGFRAQFGWGGWPWEAGTDYTTKSGEVAKNIIRVYEWDPVGTWAHEMGHALGKILVSDPLPDLYPGGKGNIGEWGIMGEGIGGWTVGGTEQRYFSWNPVHLCSWSKAELGWLEYQDIDVGWSGWIKALPQLSYGDKAYRYWFESNEFFLLEVRNRSPNYSMWDRDVPGAGLVNYDVWYQEPSWWPGNDINVEAYGLVDAIIDFPEAVIIKIVDQHENIDTFMLKISAEKFEVNNMKGAVWRPVAPPLMKSPWPSTLVFPTDNSATIDYDLHAYTPDGRHVGMNYLTNSYEVGIPGAVASGDKLSREWIFVPDNIEVYFAVSSRDVAEFLDNNPGALENENAVYELKVVYFDENGVRYKSDALEQEIAPGAEMIHPFAIAQNPDGTYSIEVEQGMDLMSFEAWQAAINNLPDNSFINQPVNRKRALKNKFGAVFNMLDVKNYSGAIEKLTNDIMKKLDADGRADWVRQPVLVNEINALVGVLR